MSPSARIPKYCHHKARGVGFVRLPNEGTTDFPGRYGSPEIRSQTQEELQENLGDVASLSDLRPGHTSCSSPPCACAGADRVTATCIEEAECQAKNIAELWPDSKWEVADRDFFVSQTEVGTKGGK